MWKILRRFGATLKMTIACTYKLRVNELNEFPLKFGSKFFSEEIYVSRNLKNMMLEIRAFPIHPREQAHIFSSNLTVNPCLRLTTLTQLEVPPKHYILYKFKFPHLHSYRVIWV